MPNTIFIDTWGWLTLNDAGERRHQEVKNFYRHLRQEQTILYTSNFVLDEVFTLFFKRLNTFQAQSAMLQLSNAFTQESFQLIDVDRFCFEQAQNLRLKYLDKPKISFTDLTSMVIMQQYDIIRVLTEDEHFQHVGLGFQLEP
ncbi:PIN domain-containing protein [Spirulina sp. CCNP1310]|uniref:type II toxin-antitoxin system VapC family toxin n=1 Tax=Spirulina sp. CCNP1310 TaxID=3110249 RepID=UPI002B1F8394|nr:PIN domain-containing protein [Spirulina sp. CCNP1310]MEA5421086.1 PIN domain-containing protein [Spirulina sp. CCNP1310]